MQSLSKYNKRNKYLLCADDTFSKYTWVVPFKYKRGISMVNAFQKIEENQNYSLIKVVSFIISLLKGF